MKINRNMSAVIANKQLLRTENRLQASIERLSSGLKLNTARDNPAGMAISNKMRAQIDGLDQADNNAQDGISVVQIADGATNEITLIIQRMRELAVQAANDTNTYEERQSIQKEIVQLRNEVDRISSDTEYNTKTLLDGSSDTRVYSQQATRINMSDTVPANNYEVTVTAAATKAKGQLEIADTFSADGSISVNGVNMEVKAGTTKEDFLHELDKVATEAGAELIRNDDGSVGLDAVLYGTKSYIEIAFTDTLAADLGTTGYTLDPDTNTYRAQSSGTNAEVTLGEGFSDNAVVSSDGNRVYIRDHSGFTMDFLLKEDLMDQEDDEGNPITEAVVDIDVTDIGRLTVQIGANQYQEMDIRIPEISSESLYLDTVDVTVYKGAGRAITTLDEALKKISGARSSIGAFQNRLEYASKSLQETSENMTAAFSLITDADMAEEMTEYAQQNILDQAAVSVLTQANDLPQQVLSLLGR